ncbi:hypothetical protein [Vibrio ezurae]|uniref:Uncharacterized protein n=1 Tax=Vibrio ezurae NBRC 102218 TaxID=1219080 RepID=U3B316_9VIBR|nr:hypothetical protein [Vibrio ezurae]GAD79847.1 hypothetical protein VEZ01S_20_01200 [Vibrio ezurae NBRC 102218]
MSIEKSEPSIEQLQQLKNQWLFSQVEVDFPTRESVLGKACYLDLIEATNTITAFDIDELQDSDSSAQFDWVKADFHKLTVLFSQFYASHSRVPVASKEYLQEFFAQIILDESTPHSLCLGFAGPEVAAVAIVSCVKERVLVSDLLLADSCSEKAEVSAILNVFGRELMDNQVNHSIYVHRSRYIK